MSASPIAMRHPRASLRAQLSGTSCSVANILAIDMEEQHIEVQLDDGEIITYEFDELDALAHAYAITVHRSQGSEYPCVVIPLTNTTPNLLIQRNLLYTAITRAKKLVVVIGHERALTRALRNQAPRRNTPDKQTRQ